VVNSDFPYVDLTDWRPSRNWDFTTERKRWEELVALCPETPLYHLLGDLDHEQWIGTMMDPWMTRDPRGDTAYADLMSKRFEQLTAEEREFYCTKWARIARVYLETELGIRISSAALRRMERQEWSQTQEWYSYMMQAWNTEKVTRWRALARLRYQVLSSPYQASDRDQARKLVKAGTGLNY
jgi:hypothetical protein